MSAALRIPRRAALAITVTTLLAAGCRGDGPARADAETHAAVAAASPGLVPGTPTGGLEDWVADVRGGLAEVVRQTAAAPATAQRRALELYVTRQEYIEQYYGEAGRLTAGPALGPAVKEAEARFHVVMQRFKPGAKPTVAEVEADVARLSEQYDAVLAAARAAGVPLVPPGNAARPAGSR